MQVTKKESESDRKGGSETVRRERGGSPRVRNSFGRFL